MTVPATIAPRRILYTMLRVQNLETSISFYRDMLGMSELGRETYPDAKFTAVFIGYGDRRSDAVLELSYNWGDNKYELGTAYGNISLAVPDLFALEAFLKEQGVNIVRPAGDLPTTSTETGETHTLCFITDPDGYKIELMQTK